ncbi:MAG: cytidine deaminase [Actinomyces sp.]|nr:MAG: cytidine deaminase [Actinomyces sp.]
MGHDRGVTGIDWAELRAAAAAAAREAYAPYSSFRVGAAGLVDDGRLVTGCNVENASYGLTLCAECGLVSDLHRTGGGRLVAVVATGPDAEPLSPCGRCRQLLHEAGGPELLVELGDGVHRLGDLLPGAFGPDDLAERPSAPPAPSA